MSKVDLRDIDQYDEDLMFEKISDIKKTKMRDDLNRYKNKKQNSQAEKPKEVINEKDSIITSLDIKSVEIELVENYAKYKEKEN